MQTIDKIGFLVHEPVLWAHYSGVWRELGRENFAIILAYRFQTPGPKADKGTGDFVRKAQELDYELVWANDLLRADRKYKYLVTNHMITGSSVDPPPWVRRAANRLKNTAKGLLNSCAKSIGLQPRFNINYFDSKQFWPLQVGAKQVRFMYGADIGEGWSLGAWNQIYDAFLCHGPNDQEQFSKRFAGKAFQMGYPRYDEYFRPDLDLSSELSEFAIDLRKKTILWMPTFGKGVCSIPHFARALAPLQTMFNIVVRPHPISFAEAPQDIELLESLGYRIDSTSVRDTTKLFRIADVVLCDQGGSAFGALYLGKRMILLDVPESAEWFSAKDSSNLRLEEFFPKVGVNEAPGLASLIDDEDFWAAREGPIMSLRERYFADNFGASSKCAARILRQLDKVLAT